MKPKKSKLTASEIRRVLRYDPKSGLLFWRVGNNQKKPGDVAGWQENTGYMRAWVMGERHTVQRIAWVIMTGRWPTGHVDHKNTDKTDNRWDNLRMATPSQNSANKKAKSDSVSGVRGVRLHEGGKWAARVGIPRAGKTKHLGLFASKEEATDAYRRAAAEIYGEFAR